MTTTGVIFDIAHQCLEAFDETLKNDESISSFSFATSDPNLVSKSVGESFRDFLGLRNSFSLWIDYTGALSSMEASLDARLRHSEHILSMVMELLEMVLRNLQRVDVNNEPNRIRPSESDAEKQQQQRKSAFQAIDSALERLHSLAVAIRQASAKQLDQSITTFLTDEDVVFRRDAAILARRRFPAARQVLCQRLGDSVAVRRRILYQKTVHAHKLARRRVLETDLSQRQHQSLVPEVRPKETITTTNRVRDYLNIVPSDMTKASLPDPQILKTTYLLPPTAPDLRSTISEINITGEDSIQYPARPRAAAGETRVQCRYCLKPLDYKQLEPGGDKYWRHHLNEDLKPYGCLFPECSESLVFFPRLREWKTHMSNAHSKEWARKVEAMVWYCDIDHESPKQFETELQWKDHVKDANAHPKWKLSKPTELQLDALSPRKQKVALRDRFVCPLCEQIPQEVRKLSETEECDAGGMYDVLDNHVANHIQSLSLLALPCLDNASGFRDTGGGSNSMKDSRRKASHQSSETQPPSGIEHMDGVSLPPEEWSTLSRDQLGSLTEPGLHSLWDTDFSAYQHPQQPPESLYYAWDRFWEWKDSNGLTQQPVDQDPVVKHLINEQATIVSAPNITLAEVTENDSISSPEHDSETEESTLLEDQLWDAAVPHASRANPSFWPPTVWKTIVTKQAITDQILQQFPGYSRENAEAIAGRVLQDKSGACVRIFTILVLLGKVERLEHIMRCRHGVRDHDLPLTLKKRQGDRRSKLCRADSKPVCCFSGWRDETLLESFEKLQRRLAVPVFRMDRRDNSLIHLDLDAEDILPWCEETEVAPINAMSGGSGTVIRVRIDPRCHEFHDTLRAINVAGGLFAVKRLRQRTFVKFRNEVDALKRFNGKIHPHLVTLLATFTQAEYYSMIFPWAECDLDQYWENNPEPDPGDVGLVRWLSRQCLGIMEAVSVIHNPSPFTPENGFGRHGDIKAENILWFKSRPDDPDDRGILVISDFSLTAINSDKSRSMQPNTGLKMTPSYRPPECDIQGGKISRSFDIWTLGCLYLELVCWLLRGYAGKVQFDEARTTTFIFGTMTNIYFDIQERKNNAPGMFVFKVKDVVSRTISELHDHPYCSQWVHDLLDMIENGMLVVLSKNRMTSQALLERVRQMDNMVQSSTLYSTGPAPQNRTSYWRPQVGTLAELNEAAQKNVVDHGVGTHESDDRPLQQWDNLSRLGY